jgi:spermidine/putrescine transport system ATP-binding protein
VNEPQVLLLDEPLGALDLKLRRQMQIELKRIQTEVGITFLHVTHDQDEAMWMADTVAVMTEGRIAQLGSPTDIYEFPSSPFVANFLGQSNLFAAEVSGNAGDDLLLTAHGERFAAPSSRAHSADGRVWLGVRPEKVRLALPGEDAPAEHNQVRGILTDTCYAGVSTEYLLKTPWGQEMSVFSANAAAGEPLQPGTEVVAHWYPPHSFVLDRRSGEGDEVTQYSADPLGVAP